MTKICSRCVFDESISKISFDEKGVCNYCKEQDQLEQEYPCGKKGEKILRDLVKKIKKAGKGRKYDCAIGVSGGCDSSYLVYKAKQLGLRPLAVHYDNTWNTNIATQNIHRVLKKLNVDLYTYVVDNEEMDELFKAFLKASVPEIEAPTDIGLATVLYIAAAKYKIKYIFNGHSFRTEGISPPNAFYFDGKYIESVNKKFGTGPIKTFPNLWFSKWIRWLLFNRVRRIRPIYYLTYDKETVKKFLNKEFGWQWYGGHHNENRFTIFSNRYYMPKKFNKDVRMLEFSALIRSGQMKREDAVKELKKIPPLDKEIVPFVKKRLGYSDKEFEKIMKAPLKTYLDFKTYKPLFKILRPFFWVMYKVDLVPKSFYMKYTK